MKRNVEVLEAAKQLDAYKIKMLKGNPHLSADIETVPASYTHLDVYKRQIKIYAFGTFLQGSNECDRVQFVAEKK